MILQLTLAWRYLNGRKLRTFLTTLAVVFGVMVIFGMNIILPTMLQSFQANMMAAGDMVDVMITHRSGGGFPMEVARKLDGIPGIRASSPNLERTANLPANFVDGDPTQQDHITAISLADSLLPFETILLAVMLEQAKEIAALRHELEQRRNG